MATLDLTNAAHSYEFRLLPGNRPTFWPRWGGLRRGYWVLATYSDASWTVTTYPGTTNVTTDDLASADHAWLAGTTHEFTDENSLASVLTNAGYTVT